MSFGNQPRRELGKQRTFFFSSLLFTLNSSSCIFNSYDYPEISKGTESRYRSLICVFKGKVKIEPLCLRCIILKIERAAPSLLSLRTSSIYSSF